MADNPSPRQPPPLVKPDQVDPDTDSNFDYDQQPDPEGEGVPREEWLPERVFDSAEWMDRPEPVYAEADQED